MRTLKRGVTPGPFIESVYLDHSRIYDPTHYAFNLPSTKSFRKLDLHPKVTFFAGENGSGKSTMLEAIAIANGLNAEGGSRNMMFATRESHSELHKALKLRRYHALVPDAWFVRAESLFNVATEIENLGVGGSYGDKSLHEQSHGEAIDESRLANGLGLATANSTAVRRLNFYDGLSVAFGDHDRHDGRPNARRRRGRPTSPFCREAFSWRTVLS